MSAYYPIALDLAGRSVVVVGGGVVAERKVQGLRAAGARVTVVAAELTPALAVLRTAEEVRHVPRTYCEGDLEGHELAFVAVDDHAVSEAVVREARRRGIWVNAADDPSRCDFVLPAVLRRGALIIAVTTGGASPALARAVRDRLAGVIPDEYGELVDLVAEVRCQLRRDGANPDPEVWRRALDDELPRLLRQGRADEARQRLREQLRAH